MAAHLRDRPPLLIRLGLCLAALLVPLGPPAEGAMVDAVLAEAHGRVVTAGDIALARALAVFGFSPSEAPIVEGDVERFIDALLERHEAERLRIELSGEAKAAAWQALRAGWGGPEALESWLRKHGIAADWARRLADGDLTRRRFLAARFPAIGIAGGPETTGQAQAAWREAARGTAGIRRVPLPAEGIPCPFPMPAPSPPA
ncbi:MAG: hypothetical protein WC713_12390 [Candidatus Methylomirabilota bacterium]